MDKHTYKDSDKLLQMEWYASLVREKKQYTLLK